MRVRGVTAAMLLLGIALCCAAKAQDLASFEADCGEGAPKWAHSNCL